jgi:hypothetical protein
VYGPDHDDIRHTRPGGTVEGPVAIRVRVRDNLAAIPDLAMTPEREIVAEVRTPWQRMARG